jgi:hypothetical protein
VVSRGNTLMVGVSCELELLARRYAARQPARNPRPPRIGGDAKSSISCRKRRVHGPNFRSARTTGRRDSGSEACRDGNRGVDSSARYWPWRVRRSNRD